MYGINTAHNVSSQVCLKMRSQDRWLNFNSHAFFFFFFFCNLLMVPCVSLELMIPCISFIIAGFVR